MTVKETAEKLNKKYRKKVVRIGKNPKYKVLRKSDLKARNFKVFIDGVDTDTVPQEKLYETFKGYKTFDIYQYSFKFHKWLKKTPIPNTKIHEKGINKECTYLQIPVSGIGSIPLHRFVFVWFNEIIKPYNDNGELMDICHKDRDRENNHIDNLKWDTRKNNLAERTGAVNQYGRRKNEML